MSSVAEFDRPEAVLPGRNPVSALFDGLRQVVIATLHLVAAIVRFSSVTVPSTLYSILHYSFTLQLNFPSLFLLFVTLLIAAFVWVRYRHLNRYERLREVPLTKDEGFNLHPDVARADEDSERGNFHNYLDEFLQAIRIFGFLEKPVFHELARHLQTRRLIAGDSISLDSDFSFYIVVDGNVQVFAPLPGGTEAEKRSDAFEDDENTGYQLLNEVESGGTLSSLFTILSLFTEDVKLGFGEDDASNKATTPLRDVSPGGDGGAARWDGLKSHGSSDEAHPAYFSPVAPLPPGSSQLQLNAASLRNVPSAVGTSPLTERLMSPSDFLAGSNVRKARYSSSTDDEQTIYQGDMENHDLLPSAQAAAPFPHFTPRVPSNRPESFTSPQMRARTASVATDGRPATPGSILSGFSGMNGQGKPSDSMQKEGVGTIGRATVDTTLAVIPAEAFKRLTKKFPDAAAHIVQVILTRLSRVTFHTAHKYLGLTKEVMRTEKSINELACFPLPSAFYEQGGMERLRQRFLPEPLKKQKDVAERDDYFQFHSRDSTFERTDRKQSSSSTLHGKLNASSGSSEKTPVRARPPSTPWGHPDPPLKTPTSRMSVDPGDLFSMTGTDGYARRSNSPFSDIVGSSKASSKRFDMARDTSGMFVASPPLHFSQGNGAAKTKNKPNYKLKLSKDLDAEPLFAGSAALQDFDLKDAVMNCIAKSIGLAQALSSPLASRHTSPSLHPQEHLQRSVFRSAFSSLSMLDAAMNYDDESSMTGTSSNFAGIHHAELENEVEIRFFEAGSILAKAGDSHAGLFYIIDGFLDVVVPPEDDGLSSAGKDKKTPSSGAKTFDKTKGRPVGASRKESYINVKSKTSTVNRGPSTKAKRTSMEFNRATPSTSAHIGNALDGTHDGRKVQSKHPLPPLPNVKGNLQNGKGGSGGRGEANDESKRALFTVGRGGIAGYLSSLLGSASYVDIRAKTDTYVGFLPARALERVMEKRPIVLLTLCKRLLSLLSPLILHIDSALDWQQVNAGQVIYRQGDSADSFYIVINGRLRAITEKSGSGVDVLDEYGQGDSVGELDVITNSVRGKTLHAIRDSEVAKMPMTLFNAISVRHPAITIQISRIIAKRVRDEVNNSQRMHNTTLNAPVSGLPDLGRNNQNLKTVAIVPVTRGVPIVEFANRLQQAFEDTIGGPTAFLDQSSVMGILGRHAFNRMGKLKLAGWLAEQEQMYRLVLYVVDTAVSSPWASTCIKQADCVLLVGFGDDPTMGEYERLLLGIKTTARKELVLLHPERSVPPGSTREWLKSRPWINAHHHVELPGITRSSHSFTNTVADPTAVKALRTLKAKLETSIQRYKGKKGNIPVGRPHHFSDFARLARRLCGRSIGVVLGGGGARGCAHVGFLRALEEKGIPIDMIGGTSIGSMVGGLYAKEAEVVSSYGRAKKYAGRTASLWRFMLDLTYPFCSYTSGFEFNRGVFKAIGSTHIEDNWISFFCVSTSLTTSSLRVHTSGYSWRYIRASMTLAGLIPPLVDDGDMYVDGGYVDNLPVSTIFAMGARDVFAVDVGSVDDNSPQSYGDTLSGWWVLINRWNPWSDAVNIPSMAEVQGRLTYVSSVKTLEDAKNTPGCLYLRMPVTQFSTLQFGSFDEIQKIGYEAAVKALDEWGKEGKLPSAFHAGDDGDGKKRRGGVSARRNSV
ncbi:hypothetical protein CBS101457_002895 [Exobasidium rhododendri]|nr:hypothetical protein CBS101457_002895 [Exobasidium rhododendri]